MAMGSLILLTYLRRPPPNSTPNGITVVLNEGPGNPAVSVVTGGLKCTPQNIVAADMNKDSKLDVLLTCVEGYVVILFGNNDGSFQTPSYYAVANVEMIAPPVDLNGDGFPDVAVTISTNKAPLINSLASVAVLLNKGSGAPGTLSPSTTYAIQAEQDSGYAIAVGDFNGDGKQDIIAGNPGQVFYGNGDGTLQTPVLTSAASGYVTGDFNRDGTTDLAYINVTYVAATAATTYSLQTLLGSPSGQFTTGETLPIATPFGDPTIVPFQNTATSTVVNLALAGHNNTLIVLNDGSGNFTAGQAYGVSGDVVTPQLGTGGNTNLLFSSGSLPTILVPGNGDGTFKAPPATILNASGCVFSDLNNDGLTDTLCIDNASNLITALGRGNGRFSEVSQTVTTGQTIVTGDFNNDGKIDAVTVFPGVINSHGGITESTAQIFFYGGNGDGTFQPALAPVSLQVGGAGTPLVGDFNGDGKLDLIVPYGGVAFEGPQPPTGVLFFAGKGDGTFAAPASLTIPWTAVSFAADVNHDGNLDIIGTNTISLGNGDGTFQQLPLGIPGTILAVADLNGDGKADLLITNTSGTSIYAGNGDGTFQATPYYTPSLPQDVVAVQYAYIGDVNGDGHPDLLLSYGTGLQIFLGNGSGNFAADPNTYYVYTPQNALALGSGALARVNNQAPLLLNDHTLDFVFNSSGGVTSLINQLNPAPAAPAVLPSKTTLATTANSTLPGQQLTLTATIIGATPSGTVSFVAGSLALGTGTVTNGIATLVTSFATAGNYSIVANYIGDANNSPSSSNAVPVTVNLVTSTTTLSVSAGSAGTNQQLTFTASVMGLNPSGNVRFASSTTTLGTASLVKGVATLPFSFTTAGSYTVTASYAGDTNNLASVSSPVAVAVEVPDYTLSATPTSATIQPGQSATSTITVTPVGGYTGTVKFSCGTLPAGMGCVFAPSSVTPSSGAATSSLTITTTASTPTTALLRKLSAPLQGVAWAGLLFLTLFPGCARGLNRRLLRTSLLTLLLAAGLATFSGCSSSSPSKTVTNPGTPAGVQIVTVTTDDSSGSPSHSINFQVTVQ